MGNLVSIGDLVAISWLDSHHLEQSWPTEEEALAGCQSASLSCETVGRLLLAYEDRIAVAQSVSEGYVDNIMIIPRLAVVSIQVVKEQ